ncbi:hypothetical protein HZS_4730 [Henneguya salminicola]|nr:hypothetical protein HZS_4730 [Henneguya salminicola]
MIKNLELCVLVANFIVSFFLSVGTGANDVANTFGSIYGSRLLPWKKIIIFASIFEFLGAMLIGKSVSETE